MPCTGKAMSSDSDRWSETHVLVCEHACFRNQVLLSLQTIMINLVQAQMLCFWVWAHLPATQMLWVLLGWCVFTGKKKDANSGLEDFVVYTFICGTHIAAVAISCDYELSYACQLFIAITNSWCSFFEKHLLWLIVLEVSAYDNWP